MSIVTFLSATAKMGVVTRERERCQEIFPFGFFSV